LKYESKGLTPFTVLQHKDRTWSVVTRKDMVHAPVRSGLDEQAAKRFARYMNEQANIKITDCCIGGCYLCDS